MLRIYHALFLAMVLLSVAACSDEENIALKNDALQSGRSGTVADFVIYNGYGIDTTGTDALVQIIKAQGLTSRVIAEDEFNGMTSADFARFGTFIWPGGGNDEIDSALEPEARTNLRRAILEKGLNYVGICAGAFIAVGPKTALDETPAWGLALIEGNYLRNYSTVDGERETMVATNFPDGSTRELMLWTGPYFDTTAQVIARYAADAKPAMVQAKINDSLIVLSGPHPEAPELWQTESGLVDNDGLDWDIAWKLMRAAHTRQPLPSW